MKLFRCDKNGYIETLYTEGSFRPKGWYSSARIAHRYRNKTYREYEKLKLKMLEASKKAEREELKMREEAIK